MSRDGALLSVLPWMFVASGALAQAGVPDVVSFQGRLRGSGGAVVADGDHGMTFRIYDAEVDGTLLWSEIQDVSTVGGLFSVLLGSVTALPSDLFDGDLWLSIEVETDGEMEPRFRLASVPYAFKARDAETLGGRQVGTADGEIVAVQPSGMLPALDGSQLSGVDAASVEGQSLANLDDRYVDAAGDTMTGPLVLLGNGLVAGTDQFVLADGNVGVGTATPTRRLEVVGDIGTSGSVTLGGIPTEDEHAASKLYVDAGLGTKADAAHTHSLADLADTDLDSPSTWEILVCTPGGWANMAIGSAGISETGHHHDAEYVNRSGDSMYGPLSLPANGLAAGTNQLVLSDGKVGIGTDKPSVLLDVAGAFRIDTSGTSPNIVGGHPVNSVTTDHWGSTICGGGSETLPNTTAYTYSVVVGGEGNSAGGCSAVVGGRSNAVASSYCFIGGGVGNDITDNQCWYSAIGGGTSNEISEKYAAIAGGSHNTVSADYGAIGGGRENTVTSAYGSIAGGWDNVAGGYCASVPGGYRNEARGNYSFAAGHRAKTETDETFPTRH